MRSRGARRIALNVMGSNEEALRLYRSAGFKDDLELRIKRSPALPPP